MKQKVNRKINKLSKKIRKWKLNKQEIWIKNREVLIQIKQKNKILFYKENNNPKFNHNQKHQ